MVSKKPIASMNDEVASILKGLQLDRNFFIGHLDKSQTKEMMNDRDLIYHADPSKDKHAHHGQRRPSIGHSTTTVLQASKKATKAHIGKKTKDFDLYLGQALMPVLAQALDSLCRQLNHMKLQGDGLDPKVRARFNPLTWLAQQLLRRHPKCAKSPRRQAIYSNFRDWSDLERGRREMLRRRKVVQEVFEGFCLKGTVHMEDMPSTVDAIDEDMRLDGALKSHKDVRRALGLDVNLKAMTPSEQKEWKQYKEKGWNFTQFWQRLARVIMCGDVVSYSQIKRGIHMLEQQESNKQAAEEAHRKEEEEWKKQELQEQENFEAYTVLRAEIMANEHILAILNESKILTGDDVRPTDAGYEFEVPPSGAHVALLVRFLNLLGFENLETKRQAQRGSKDSLGPTPKKADGTEVAPAPPPEASRWWDDDLAAAWITLQQILMAEIADGVVEQEVLQKALVNAEAYAGFRNQVLDELASRADQDGMGPCRGRRGRHHEEAADKSDGPKPSIDQLCQTLGFTMSRMVWLHHLFESFLPPDPLKPGEIPHCGYPENPAEIPKERMMELMHDLRPGMTDEEFEMRFRRIDLDGSGSVEFDEFTTWVREDEVKVQSSTPAPKMGFEDLAYVHEESTELVMYLFARWEELLPEGEHDEYPVNAKSIEISKIRELASSLTPSMTDDDFKDRLESLFSGRDSLDFDEFLEFIPWDELPEELREEHEPPAPSRPLSPKSRPLSPKSPGLPRTSSA